MGNFERSSAFFFYFRYLMISGRNLYHQFANETLTMKRLTRRSEFYFFIVSRYVWFEDNCIPFDCTSYIFFCFPILIILPKSNSLTSASAHSLYTQQKFVQSTQHNHSTENFFFSHFSSSFSTCVFFSFFSNSQLTKTHSISLR